MDALLAALAATDLSVALRFSRWGYATVNTAHVMAIALLVGPILALDLRLLGLWPSTDRRALVRVLVPVAATGLASALVTGALLFSVRPVAYAGLAVFQLKLIFIVFGTASAIAVHAAHGWWLERAGRGALIRAAAVSMICWVGALVAGRLIAFAGA